MQVAEIQNLLTQLDEKWLQSLGQVIRIDGTRVSSTAVELKLQEKITTGWQRTWWFSMVMEAIKRGKNWQEIKNERLWD